MAGTLTISTLSDGTNSTSSTNCIQGSAKAWVNFNQSTNAIRSSYNVSSITHPGTSQSVINFTNAFADANYCGIVTGQGSGYNSCNNYTPTTTSISVTLPNPVSANQDQTYVMVAVFR